MYRFTVVGVREVKERSLKEEEDVYRVAIEQLETSRLYRIATLQEEEEEWTKEGDVWPGLMVAG